MIDRLRGVLEADSRILYALMFGSRARGTVHPESDIDVAVGLADGVRLDTLALGGLISRLEEAAGAPVDLVLLDEASPGLAYRIFRDGRTILVRDRDALTARRARAVLEYLDFQPVETACARRVLARGHGR